MPLYDSLPSDKQKDIYKKIIKTGDVFLKKFDEADHKKLFIVAGISSEKIYVCSVFINSGIHPSILHKPQLLKLHIPLFKSRNKFLNHDSYVNCSYPIFLNTEQIIDGLINSSCKIIGEICSEDLDLVQNALINSGLLTEDEIELFFKR